MTRRGYKPPSDQQSYPESVSALPTHRPIAVYYRQSTDAQVGNVSTTIQTVDMVHYLEQRGWNESDILMIDMDAGISGTTKIDERPGMRRLFDLITDGKLGVVACQDEDRLFRDVTQIQVNIFIEACRQSQTMVLTPSMVYDFSHPKLGVFHARQFRFKSEMSAEYITSYIRGRLHPARKRLMMDGLWAGWSVPLGYLIDTRRRLPDGGANPNWRRYTPYEPFAEIVREWFDVFLRNGGNISATVKQILQSGPYYPDPETTTVPEGFRFVPSYRLRDYGTGYCLGDVGLTGLLTNVAYVGHWAVNDIIVRYNNHPPILDEQTFFRAYNYLSDRALDGQPNPDYRPYQRNARPTLDEHRTAERPLFSGMIFTDVDGAWRLAGTRYVGRYGHYGYGVTAPYPIEYVVWWKRADYIDDALTRLLKEKLDVTFNASRWQQTLAEFQGEFEKERHFKQKQLDTLRQTMDNLLLSLENLSHPDMIKRVQERYGEAEREHARLSADVSTANGELLRLEALASLKDSCAPALDRWDQMTRDEKIVVIQSFISRVVATPLPGQAISLEVEWRDGTTDEIAIARCGSTYKGWLKTHEEQLFVLVDAGASQLAIASAFPERTWEAIRAKVWAIRGKGSLQVSPLPMRDTETYEDYLKRTNGGSRVHTARSGERWNDRDLEKLKQMVKRGASQVEIAASFPHRNWGRIRATITKVCGKNVSIPGTAPENGQPGDIRKYETYLMYLERIEGNPGKERTNGVSLEDPGEDSLADMSSQDCRGTGLPGAPDSPHQGAECRRRRSALAG